MQLGKLKEVPVRQLWKHEQYDFSKWIAHGENIELLNEILGLTLVDVDKEVYVGAYRCDIVAQDETTGVKVIIENQLEPSNHDHLGKIITYASGLDASVIVWIVTEAREEHRSAIEWLNNNTSQNVNFFLIELHAYQIGDSLPAPKFEVIESPNGFIKLSKTKNGKNEMTKTQSARLEFWTMFNDVVAERGKPFNIRKPSTDHWYDVSIGTSGAYISITLVNKEGIVGVELHISDDKELFDRLLGHKQEIEESIGTSLEWQRLDKKKASRIVYKIPGLNFEDPSHYHTLMDEVIDWVIKFRREFKRFI